MKTVKNLRYEKEAEIDNDEEEDVLMDLPQIKIDGELGLHSETVINIQDNIAVFRAPDGGYGWVIVVASFLALFLSEGFIYSFGAFYEDLQELFDLDTTTYIMLIGLMLIGFSCGSGPFIASLCNRFGFKYVTIASGSAFSMILIGCSFSPNIIALLILLGLFGGCALGGIVLPAYTMFTQWFDKKRPLACSLAFAGAGAGCIVYPIMIDFLVLTFTIRGAILIIGAVFLNIIPIGLLIRDPMKIVEECEPECNDAKKEYNSKPCLVSSDAMILSKNSLFNSELHSRNFYSSGMTNYSKNSATINIDSSYVVVLPSNKNVEHIQTPEDIPCIEQSAYLSVVQKTLGPDSVFKSQNICEDNLITSLANINAAPDQTQSNKIKKAISREFARPFIRDDIFASTMSLSGIKNIFKSKDSGINNSPIRGNGSIIIVTKKDVESPIIAALRRIFNVNLFKIPAFHLISFLSITISVVTLSLIQSMRNYAIFIQMNRFQFSYYVSVYGLVILLSKPILGIITVKFLHWELFHFATSLLLALTTMITAYIGKIEYIIAYGGILALCSSNLLNLRSLLITRYIPRKHVTSAFGYTFLTCGLSMTFAPFIGLIGSIYNYFNLSFGIYGLLCLLSGTSAALLLTTKRQIVDTE